MQQAYFQFNLKTAIIVGLLLLKAGNTHRLYAQTDGFFLHPISVEADPMLRLLLINIEKDPDSVYIGFEPQVFDDDWNGTGHQVIGWRKDGKIDVYYQEGIIARPEKYDIAGKGLHRIQPVKFEASHFDVDSYGVDAHYKFKDYYGRNIELKVKEKNPKARKPFDLLAPMGDAAEHPSALPMIFLFDFYFVRKNHTEFEINVNGRLHQPDAMPMKLDGQKVYFTRYSPSPFIALLNPAYNGNLELEQIDSLCAKKSVTHHYVNHKTEPKLAYSVIQNHGKHISIYFDPHLPDLRLLSENSKTLGHFHINSSGRAGSISGEYLLEKNANGIHLKFIPSGGWQPQPDRFFLRFLYRVAKPFKNWPRTYEWNARIEEKDGEYLMQSAWKRIPKK